MLPVKSIRDLHTIAAACSELGIPSPVNLFGTTESFAELNASLKALPGLEAYIGNDSTIIKMVDMITTAGYTFNIIYLDKTTV